MGVTVLCHGSQQYQTTTDGEKVMGPMCHTYLLKSPEQQTSCWHMECLQGRDAEAQTEMHHNFIESKEGKKVALRGGNQAESSRDSICTVWSWRISQQLSI